LKSTSSAPAKVILFGEHFIVYGGKAILCSINKRITVESELTKTSKIEIDSDLGTLDVPKNVDIKDVDSVFRPLVYLAKKILKQDSGVKISVTSEIPSGVGLGSSSACCVAAASSILGLYGKPSKEEILKLAIDAEKTIFENASGADSSICVYGGIMEYSKKGSKGLDLKPKFKLVIANSKVSHSTSQVVARVKKFKEKQPDVFSAICDNEASLIEEALQDLKKNDVKSLGQKMLVNQAHLDKIGVSNDTLDAMLDSIRDISHGAKITGAGDGGCIIALVDDKNMKKTLDSLKKKYECFAVDIDATGVEGGN
jgi:mevalonate kinase